MIKNLNLMKKYLVVFMTIITVIWFGCSSSDDNGIEGAIFDSIVQENATVIVSSEVLNGILNAVPSPVEMTSIIESSGADYNEDLLNPSENSDNYSTNYKLAINLGIYGTDMGYLNMYEKTVKSLLYLEKVKGIADKLKVGQFFDFSTMKRLASNKQNIDSIIYISTLSFEKMNNYLTEQKRGHISALILIGGWIEALNLSCQIEKITDNKDLRDRIGEQKEALSQIVAVLEVYEKHPLFKDLVVDIEKLKKAYENVQIVITKGEDNVTIDENGMMVIESNDTQEIKMSTEDLENIIKVTEEIRNKLIS